MKKNLLYIFTMPKHEETQLNHVPWLTAFVSHIVHRHVGMTIITTQIVLQNTHMTW